MKFVFAWLWLVALAAGCGSGAANQLIDTLARGTYDSAQYIL